jgi:quercetin dioxygenase-like cupin family protein
MAETTTARTPGAKRAAPGEYYFELAKLNSIMGGPEYSTAQGGCVEGDRMMAALMRMPKGTGSEPHSHPNEQWIYLLEGTLDCVVGGKPQRVKPGSVVYIPADTVHHAVATPDADVLFFTVKDTSHGLHGVKAASGKGGAR